MSLDDLPRTMYFSTKPLVEISNPSATTNTSFAALDESLQCLLYPQDLLS